MKFFCFSHRDISMPSTFLFFFSSLTWHFSSFNILHAFIFGKTWYFRIMEISRTVYQGQRRKESLQHDFKTAHYILWTSVEVLPAFCLANPVHLRELYCVRCGGSRWVWVSWFSSPRSGDPGKGSRHSFNLFIGQTNQASPFLFGLPNPRGSNRTLSELCSGLCWGSKYLQGTGDIAQKKKERPSMKTGWFNGAGKCIRGIRKTEQIKLGRCPGWGLLWKRLNWLWRWMNVSKKLKNS